MSGAFDPAFDIAIVGGGIAGIACAHALSRHGKYRIALIEELAPLSLTSDKSTECYRNWWPGPGDAMVGLTTRSIEMMESMAKESGNRFNLDRRGYLYATARRDMAEEFADAGREAETLGAGPLRVHERSSGFAPIVPQVYDSPIDGADLILDRALIRASFPYLSESVQAVMLTRRCGALSAQQLGMLMLEQARDAGVELISAKAVSVELSQGKVSGLSLAPAAGRNELRAEHLDVAQVVVAAGPYAREVASTAGIELPLVCEKHIKLSLADHRVVIPRDAPLSIWTDPTQLRWTDEEHELLDEDPQMRYLLESFPAGVHGRAIGAGDRIVLYWTYHEDICDTPVFPLEWDDALAEITLRGMAVMVPGLEAYFESMPSPYVDGGYYTRTRENRPLIGPTEVGGLALCCGFSGFGIMASCASGELLSKHLLGEKLPEYAPAFLLSRYDDPDYRALLQNWPQDGQL